MSTHRDNAAESDKQSFADQLRAESEVGVQKRQERAKNEWQKHIVPDCRMAAKKGRREIEVLAEHDVKATVALAKEAGLSVDRCVGDEDGSWVVSLSW